MSEPAAGTPRIAVLMSTYNGATFLEAQLDSLAAQEGVETALFARDDGSTDATLAILARWAGRWPTLAAPLTGANLGPAMSFLTLLAAAPEGFDGYAFCDQDDVWPPGKLARAAEALAGLPAAAPALYCSQVTCVDANLTPIGQPFNDGDASFAHLLFENVAFGVTVVMNAAARRAVVARLPTSGVIMHDWWCALVVSALGTVVHDPRPGVLYRQHGGNVIGAAPGALMEIGARLRAFFRDPGRFWPVRAQAAAFLEIHGDRIGARDRDRARRLVESRASVASRLRYALAGPVKRSRWWGAVFARALVVAGLY